MPNSNRHIVVETSEEEFEALVAKPSFYTILGLVPTNMLSQQCTLVVRSSKGRLLEFRWQPALLPTPDSE